MPDVYTTIAQQDESVVNQLAAAIQMMAGAATAVNDDQLVLGWRDAGARTR